MFKSAHKPYWIVFLAGALLYAPTLTYDYVLDDKIVITQNEFVQQGLAGIPDILSNDVLVGFYGEKKALLEGGRYRPLSLVTFAIENQFFGNSPFIGHLGNVLLYGLTGVVLLWLLGLWLPPGKQQNIYFSIPFITTLLFLVHPLHTEAVANIKGRDEILAMLGGLLALGGLWRYLDSGKRKYLFGALAAFFLGILAKEVTLTLVAVIPLALWYFRRIAGRDLLRHTLLFLGAAVAYLMLRVAVVGGLFTEAAPQLMNNPFLHADFTEKYATILYTLGCYLKLLFFPHPLTHDYYPYHIPLVNWSHAGALLSLVIYLLLFTYAVRSLRTRSLPGFGIWFYLLTLSIVSNIVLPVGTFMNERFLFMPSLGFCLALAWGVLRLQGWQDAGRSRLTGVLTALLVVTSGARSLARMPAWQSDFTLATTDVQTSANSAKANMYAGNELLLTGREKRNPQEKQTMLRQAEQHLLRALEIHPRYFPPLDLLGNVYFELGDYQQSLDYYQRCLAREPGHARITQNVVGVGQRAMHRQAYEAAQRAFELALQYDNNNVKAHAALGELYGRVWQDYDRALKHLRRAHELAPQDTDVLQKLGVLHATRGQYRRALEWFEQALTYEPDNAYILKNAGITCQELGKTEQARKYLEQAFELEPGLRE